MSEISIDEKKIINDFSDIDEDNYSSHILKIISLWKIDNNKKYDFIVLGEAFNWKRLAYLILDNMNELGLKSQDLHIKVIKQIEKYQFDEVILSGDFFKKALSIFSKLKNNYVYKSTSKNIMSYLKKKLHKNAIIMAKCSNKTEVNKFVSLIKLKKKG